MGGHWPKGPWTIEARPEGRASINIVADGEFVAVTPNRYAASLIASAPDLAEALDGVLQAHSNLAIHMAVAEHSRDPANIVRQSRLLDALDTACEAAHAALAKARGETP